jgi:hypothetical protein
MKQIIFAVIFILGFNYCYAQPAYSVSFIPADTLTNADTVVKNITLSTTLNGIVLQPVVTRISGTAAGKMVLLQSIDGTNFIRTDSVSFTNVVTNTAFISKSQPTALYYRVEFISSGTTKLWPQLWYLSRKEK